MNALGDLLRARRDTLKDRGVRIGTIIEATGMSSATVYEYLSRRDPFVISPRRATLERLAAAFQLELGEVLEAAKQSTEGINGDPLQVLIRSAQINTGRSARDAARRAAKAGHKVSEATISEILSGKAGVPGEATLTGLAAGFDLDPDVVARAAGQAKAKITYRLPAHLEDRLTPERWAKVLRVIEGVLDVSDGEP